MLLLAAMSASVGCAGDSNPGASGGTGGTGGATTGTGGSGGGGNVDSSTDCTLRTDLDTYVANMSKKGKNNSMSFQLVQSNPAPPAKTDNDFKVKITDAGGTPVTTRLKVKVSMPEHNHDSPIAPTIVYDAQTQTFDLIPVSMKLMGGVWRVRLEVMDANDEDIPIDTVDFNFCIS